MVRVTIVTATMARVWVTMVTVTMARVGLPWLQLLW